MMAALYCPGPAEYRRRTDLQRDAVRLCIAFQSQLNPAFLGAATELLSCVAKLPPQEFRRHSRKVSLSLLHLVFKRTSVLHVAT
jgi:hypothetical protein